MCESLQDYERIATSLELIVSHLENITRITGGLKSNREKEIKE